MWKCSIIVIVGILISLGATTQATIIDFYYDDTPLNPVEVIRSVSFDYDAQELTINETIYDLDYEGFLRFRTWADSESEFRVTKTLVNNTGVTWTAYDFSWGFPLIAGSPAYLVEDSLTSTKFQTTTFLPMGFVLTGPPEVPHGQSFTIEFDLSAPDSLRPYDNVFFHIVVPEPTTIVLFGLGWFVSLRFRRS